MRVSNTCYARITHAPCAYRRHATHVSLYRAMRVSNTCYARIILSRHVRIAHMLRTYHARVMRVSNTCYTCITHALRAYRTHATFHTRTTRVLITCYTRNTNAPRAYRMSYQTHATRATHTRQACIEWCIEHKLRTYQARVMCVTIAHNITRRVRIERMLRPNLIRAMRVSNTCYARITHVPRAYRTHATHVSLSRHARIEHMLRT